MKRTIRKKRIIQDVVDMKMRVNYVTDVGWAESWLFEGCCQLRRFVRHPCIHDHVAASLGEKDGCGPSPTACQQNIHVPSVFSHSASVRVRTVYYRSGRSQPQVRCSNRYQPTAGLQPRRPHRWAGDTSSVVETRLTSSTQALPAIWLSSLALGTRATMTMISSVLVPVLKSMVDVVQPAVVPITESENWSKA